MAVEIARWSECRYQRFGSVMEASLERAGGLSVVQLAYRNRIAEFIACESTI